MKNQRNKQQKLAFEKFQIAKISKPRSIIGGNLYCEDDKSGGVMSDRPGGDRLIAM
ncbi:hypothetical protein PG911_00485 [Tenacibaculum ovolyticum]|uniref:hypothetical protein n=1 Tax=Tenacibaculum ovolyticum TaxID=104270 RepID=UPI0022F3C70E|nr:hypothetical protein [Tenacibaculum ovolyticum]WBX76768.1 hypothetical protein PG911_00485 [Tenacibaculum ovolyticum]